MKYYNWICFIIGMGLYVYLLIQGEILASIFVGVLSVFFLFVDDLLWKGIETPKWTIKQLKGGKD
jgi:hypothetical protein